MASFKLTKGADTYECDTMGGVRAGGADAGRWRTARDNTVVVATSVGAEVPFAVAWRFNEANQLCLYASGKEIFNFHAAGSRPFYATKNGVLTVRPDRNHVFGFDLRGEWDITDDHDLKFTVNGETSIIDGFVDDSRSRFMYHFYDQKDLTQESILGFVGEWHERVDDTGVPALDFAYKREDGSTDTFSLPRGVVIDRTVNQLMYAYDKNGRTYQVQFVGLLKVSDDFQITYAIDRQAARTGEQQVGATTLTIKAELAKEAFTGDLELVVRKRDGSSGTYTLGVGGRFTARVGSTRLQAAFVFTQERGPNQSITTTFGFNGTLQFKNGELQWAFSQNARTTVISLRGSYDLGDARADARLNIELEGGRLKGVYMLLGVRF